MTDHVPTLQVMLHLIWKDGEAGQWLIAPRSSFQGPSEYQIKKVARA